MTAPNVLQSLMSSEKIQDLAVLLAHEFRVPVHALEAYLSVMRQGKAGPLNDVQSDLVASMFLIVRRLERLTHDVEVMTATDGAFPIALEEIDIMHVVGSCVWELKPLGDGYSVNFQVKSNLPADFHITADPVRIEQIVLNILENAVRYSTPNSSVNIRLRHSPSKVAMIFENRASLPVNVLSDDAFQASVRGSTSHEHHPAGSGIGLNVVDQLVRAHRGRVLVTTRDSLVRFMVILPRFLQDAPSCA